MNHNCLKEAILNGELEEYVGNYYMKKSEILEKIIYQERNLEMLEKMMINAGLPGLQPEIRNMFVDLKNSLFV